MQSFFPESKGRVALQTLYYIPVVISSVATSDFTKLFFNISIGIINQILSFVNFPFKFMEWISNPQISFVCNSICRNINISGLYMVFYAALIGVPDEPGEAALD